MSQSIKKRLLSSANGLSDGIGNTMVDASFVDQSSEWPLSQEDLSPDKNPFLEMSQDQIQKLDAVLSSEQAKRILGETSTQYELSEPQQKLPFALGSESSEGLDKTLEDSLSYIMNGANLTMLGHKSEDFLQAFDSSVVPIQVVGPDLLVEDVEVEMATEILAEEISEESEFDIGFLESCILLDHNYCMIPVPEQSNEVQVTAEEFQEREDSEELIGKRTDEEEERDPFGGNNNKGHSGELPDSTVSPIRRSQRQIEKIEREQLEKIKAENAEIQRKEKEEMIRVKHFEEEQSHSERMINVDLPLTQTGLSVDSSAVTGNESIFSSNILAPLNSPLDSQESAVKTFDNGSGGVCDDNDNVQKKKDEFGSMETESGVSQSHTGSILRGDPVLSPTQIKEVPSDKHNLPIGDSVILPNEMDLEPTKSLENLQAGSLVSINLEFSENVPNEPSKAVKSEETASSSAEIIPNFEVDRSKISTVVTTMKTDDAKALADHPPKSSLSKKDRRDSIDKIDEAFGRVVVRRLSEGLKKDGDRLMGFGKQDSMRKSYPKRENRKPPGYLMDMFEPALFSKPDRMKKIDSRYDYKSDGLDEDSRKTTLEMKPEVDDNFQTMKGFAPCHKDQDVCDGSSFNSGDILSHCVATVESKTNKIEEFLCKTEGDVMIVEHEHQDGVMDILEIKGSPVPSDAGKDFHPLTIDEDFKAQQSQTEKHASKDKMRMKEKRQKVVLKRQVSGTRRKAKQSGKRLLSKGNKKALDVNRPNESTSDDDDPDGSEDSDWCSEDDPDRLWCICKQPHNDRFMISCDKCEDWFHGSCVGVTRKLGRELEKSGKEWVCQKCTKERLQEKDMKNDQKMIVTDLKSAKLPLAIHGKQQKATVDMEQNVTSKARLQKSNRHALAAKFEGTEKVTGRPLLNQMIKISSEEKTSKESCRSLVHPLTEEEKFPLNQEILPVQGKASTQLCVMGCQRPARANSVFCGNECILQHAGESLEKKGLGKEKGKKEQTNKQIQELFKPEHQMITKRVSVIERRTGRILTGPNAPTERNLQEWLKLHPSFEVLSPTQRMPERQFHGPQRKMIKLIQPQHMPVELTPESSKLKTVIRPTVVVIEKKEEKRCLVDQKSKPQTEVKSKSFAEVKQKVAVDQKTKLAVDSKSKLFTDVKVASSELLKVKGQEIPKPKPAALEIKGKASFDSKGKSPVELKGKGAADVKQPPPTPPSPQTSQGPEPVRVNVRKTLQDILTTRSKDTDDAQISVDEIQKISLEIEEELFKMFNDTGTKYKAKYRSLIFNIKDQRNHGLFRKILRGKIKPDKLVRMTPEELASKELAMWREREAKHTLEMIKREQEEQQQQHTTIIKKTHKGEIEIDDDGLGFTEKPKNKQETIIEPLSPTLVDTTDSHRSHLFDLNCKICTGKMLAPSDGQPSPKKVRVAKSISVESKSQDENENEGCDDKEEQMDDMECKSQVITVQDDDPEENLTEKEDEIIKLKDKSKEKDNEMKNDGDAKGKMKESDDRDQAKGTPKVKNPDEHGMKMKSKGKLEKSKCKDKQERVKEKQKPKDKIKSDKLKSTSKKDKTKESTIKKVKKASSVTKSILKQDIADREPSSTVTISSPDSALPGLSDDSKSAHPSVWKGFVMMQDVAKFVTNAYKVSGPTDFLAQDIPDTIQVCGRIAPNTVWDYLSKVKQSGNKEFLVIRFSPANEEEKVAYVSFYSYLSSRNRFGVVGNSSRMIKDFYILPLASHSSVPATLLPFDGPGLEETRPHMLLGVIIRHKGKRRIPVDVGSDLSSKSSKRTLHMADSIENSNDSSDVTIISKDTPLSSKKVKFDLNVKASTVTDADVPYEPSYTPPLEDLPKTSPAPDGSSPYEPSFTPPLDQMPKTNEENDSPYSPGHSDPMEEDDANKPYDPEEAEEAVKMSKKIIPGLLAGSVSSQSVSELIDQISMSSNPTEITTTVLASIATATNLEQQRKLLIELTQKVEEQKRQLEMQKQQIATKVTAQVMGAMAPFSMVPSTSFPSSTTSSGLSLDTKDGTKSALSRLDFESLHQNIDAYSPSYTPPLEGPGVGRSTSDSVSSSQLPSGTLNASLKLPDTSNISLPPNLQEILESIKKQGVVASVTEGISSAGPPDSKNLNYSSGTSSVKDEIKINVLEEDPIIKKFSGDVDDVVDVPDDELPPGIEPEKCKGVEELKCSTTKQSDPRLKGKIVQHNPRLKVSVSTPVISSQLSGLESQKRSELGSLSASELMEKALKQFEDLPPPPPPPPPSLSSSLSTTDIGNSVLSSIKTVASSTTKRRTSGTLKGTKSSAESSSSKNTKSTFSGALLKEPPPPGLEDVSEDQSSNSMLAQQGASSQMVAYPLPPGPFVPTPPPPPPYPGPPGFGTQSIFPSYQTSYPAPHPAGYWASDHSGHQDWRGGGPRFRGRGRGRWESGTRGSWSDHPVQDSAAGSTSEWGFRDKDERNRDWPRERENDRDDRDRYRDRDRDRRDDRRERNRDRDRSERNRSRVRDKDRGRDRSRSRHRD